jgi:hypothetical protein
MTQEERVKQEIDELIARLPAESRYAVMECRYRIQALMMLYKREIAALAVASIGADAAAAVDENEV